MRARARRGVTLIEIMVALAVMAVMASLVYGAFDAMGRTRKGVDEASDRYQQGRNALSRISREVQSAFLSLHRPLENPGLQVSQTLFKGQDHRVDFTSFSHRRLGFSSRESDQNELSYFLATNKETGATDLARREAIVIDLKPDEGGVIQTLAEDVVSFDLSYLDPQLNEWVSSWDSSQPTGQFERLPKQVKVDLVLAHQSGGSPYRFSTKVAVAMQAPLMFGLPR